MKHRPLAGTSLALSELGYGCAGLGGAYRPITREEALETLSAAWEAGVRYFDVAPAYGAGAAERVLGDFLRDKPPGEYVISTKVGKLLRPSVSISPPRMPFEIDLDYSYDGIMRSVEFSRCRLGLAKIDMLFVDDLEPSTLGFSNYRRHLPAFLDTGVKALERLRSSGEIAAFGLGVNDVGACIDVMHRVKLDCLLLNGRYTLLDRTAGTRVIGMCERSGTPMIVGSLFNSGALVGREAASGTISEDVAARAQAARQIADDANISIDTAAVQFPLRNTLVASALLGTTRHERIRSAASGLAQVIPETVWGRFTSLAFN
ncbi:aldo/keto reductase (plasmid) [Rhizobium grahamii]|uniref:Aldo/keto reductase n=1 Tax=Rhizobium grahamii TaxID=1120045 RepID=A0A5Q0CEP9_9HYPH|nr:MULTISPECIES: aldo/keto reductase [Rhizobium]QFY62964.1 aldo/keto reductase [Rhizobium grahamii]QRM52281.1 aldo/keto reductase [Rhizobium sp. BG6]